MQRRNKPEVLAPAGNLRGLKTAVDYGADAVYCGGKAFGMRSAPKNLSLEDFEEGSRYAHEHGARVYVTCNVLPRNSEVEAIRDYLGQLKDTGVDALIVSDFGVMMTAREVAPELELHVSTQAGITNYGAARAFYELGAKRVVLAREMDLQAVRDIRARIPEDMDIECFVHGAMCMAFSGRCLFSNYLTGRDGNHGECAQPCRWKYSIVEEKRPGQYFPIEQTENGAYLFNSQDMNMLEHIDDLIDSGATSLKIEGRSKSAYYIAAMTNAYKTAVNQYMVERGFEDAEGNEIKPFHDMVIRPDDPDFANAVPDNIEHNADKAFAGVPDAEDGQAAPQVDTVHCANIGNADDGNLSYHARSTRRKSNTAAEITSRRLASCRSAPGTACGAAGLAEGGTLQGRPPRLFHRFLLSAAEGHAAHRSRGLLPLLAGGGRSALLVAGRGRQAHHDEPQQDRTRSAGRIPAGRRAAAGIHRSGFRFARRGRQSGRRHQQPGARVFDPMPAQRAGQHRHPFPYQAGHAESRITRAVLSTHRPIPQSNTPTKASTKEHIMTEYDDAILDSLSISSTDKAGRPIPVTIPIALAPGVTVTYTTRLGGLSTGEWGNCNLGGKGGDSAEAVLSNRIALSESLGAPLSIISQVHSGKAVDMDEVFGRNAPFGYDFSGTQDDEGHAPAGVSVIEADAQVTSRAGVALGVFAADCLPVLLADPQAGDEFGVAHCGRKGLQQGVIGSAVDLMVAKGAVPERIVATLGPRICGDCYETGDRDLGRVRCAVPRKLLVDPFRRHRHQYRCRRIERACRSRRGRRQHHRIPPARERRHTVSERGCRTGGTVRSRWRGAGTS